MTIQDLINKLRKWLQNWIGLQNYLTKKEQLDDLGMLVEAQNQLTERIEALEQAYLEDPRRKEIAAEKEQAKNLVPGFRPFSKRKAAWEKAHSKDAGQAKSE